MPIASAFHSKRQIVPLTMKSSDSIMTIMHAQSKIRFITEYHRNPLLVIMNPLVAPLESLLLTLRLNLND
jgi:hypothetical protein